MNSKGQTSIEVIILVVIVIGLATFVVSRYTLQQNNIFVTATAREAFLGYTDYNLSQNVYLDKVVTFECPTAEKFRIALFINPDLGAVENDKLEVNIKNKINSTINTDSNIVVKINPTINFLLADPDPGSTQC